MRSWRPPFHASPVVCKCPISNKSQFTRPPFEKKIGNQKFCLYSLNFYPNFSSQSPKFENFSSHDPNFRGKNQFTSSTLRKSGPHTPTWKKLSPPPTRYPFFKWSESNITPFSNVIFCFPILFWQCLMELVLWVKFGILSWNSQRYTWSSWMLYILSKIAIEKSVSCLSLMILTESFQIDLTAHSQMKLITFSVNFLKTKTNKQKQQQQQQTTHPAPPPHTHTSRRIISC